VSTKVVLRKKRVRAWVGSAVALVLGSGGLSVVSSAPASAQACNNWLGGSVVTQLAWAAPLNWSGGLPGPNSTVCFGQPVQLSGVQRTVGTIVGPAGTLLRDSSLTATIDRAVRISGWIFNGTSSLSSAGAMAAAPGSIVTIAPKARVTIANTAPPQAGGVITGATTNDFTNATFQVGSGARFESKDPNDGYCLGHPCRWPNLVIAGGGSSVSMYAAESVSILGRTTTSISQMHDLRLSCGPAGCADVSSGPHFRAVRAWLDDGTKIEGGYMSFELSTGVDTSVTANEISLRSGSVVKGTLIVRDRLDVRSVHLAGRSEIPALTSTGETGLLINDGTMTIRSGSDSSVRLVNRGSIRINGSTSPLGFTSLANMDLVNHGEFVLAESTDRVWLKKFETTGTVIVGGVRAASADPGIKAQNIVLGGHVSIEKGSAAGWFLVEGTREGEFASSTACISYLSEGARLC
jgi:hypothetical protein